MIGTQKRQTLAKRKRRGLFTKNWEKGELRRSICETQMLDESPRDFRFFTPKKICHKKKTRMSASDPLSGKEVLEHRPAK